MEAFYLLCSILSTFFSSLILSLLLPFRSLLCRRSAATDGHQPVFLYQGTVWHERRRPVHHSFRYAIRYALIDLDHASHALPDHLSADECRSIAETNGPVLLLTIPPSVGYEQNPLSLYYCYEIEGFTENLKKCIAEVTNTPWGERVSFLFNPNTDLIAKPLHVSPFMLKKEKEVSNLGLTFATSLGACFCLSGSSNLVCYLLGDALIHHTDMLGNWRIKTTAPGDNLFISISVRHPKLGDYFTATLTAKRIPSLATDHALFFWLMPHKAALWIYWHAVKLWWKGVPFIQHPRYSNPAYRQEALLRDGKLQCCQAFAQDKPNHLPVEGSDSVCGMSEYGRNRRFTWRDAKWPWS